MSLPQLVMLAIFPVLISGCQSSKPATEKISGLVNFEEKPLASGRIEFMPKSGEGTSAGTNIKEGQYELQLQPGSYDVRITAMRVIGKQKVHPEDPQSQETEISEQYIPDKYNRKTTLTMGVPSSGSQDFNLDAVKSH